MDTNELIFEFKEHLAVLNRSAATIDAYTEHITPFLKTVSVSDIRQVTVKMINEYITGLFGQTSKYGKPFTLNTICIKVRSIKRFFEFLERSNLIFLNPAEFIQEPRVDKKTLKMTLTPGEVKTILDQPNLGTLYGIRDRAVLETFYATGIRLNELCSLTIHDVDLQEGLLRINKGKGCKDRVVPIGKHAKKFLREYINKVRPRLTIKNRSNRHLFVDRYGGRISDQVVAIGIRNYAKTSGIRKHITAHTFRHTFATVLVKNGADIVSVQKMLGHADLKTTEHYLGTMGLDVKAVHRKTHPREKDKEPASIAKPDIKTRVRSYADR